MGHGEVSFISLNMRPWRGENRVERHSQLRTRNLTALALVVLLMGVVPLSAKDKKPQSRTVTGTVFDEAENPIQGAAVELTDLQTQKVLDIYSQDGGQYLFADLRFDHDYTVKATYKGASSEVRRVSILESRAHLVLNLTIPKTPK